MGIYIMVPRNELEDIAKKLEGKKKPKESKKKEASRKTTTDHLEDFAENSGQKIGGRGFLVG